jgi:hypothetical protein
MAKRELDRFASLAADIASPRVLPAIDRALEENQRERLELLELRKMAARRHANEFTPPPPEGENEPDAASRTMADLTHAYRTDERSPYHKTRHATRKGYDRLLDRINLDAGAEKLSNLKA